MADVDSSMKDMSSTTGGKRGKRRGSRKMRRSRRYQNENEQEQQNQQGGNSAWEGVAKAAGLPGQQVGAASPSSGALVLTKTMGGGSDILSSILNPKVGGNLVASAAKYGGSEDMEKYGGKKGKKGGNLLGQVAVPAVLLYANQMVGRRSRSTKNRRSGRRNSRGRRSRRFRR